MAVEFALTLPVFLMFLVSTIALGHGFFTLHTTQYAINSAARELIIDSSLTETQLQTMINDQLGGLGVSPITLSYNIDRTGAVPIGELTTNLTYSINLPLVPALEYSMNLEASSPIIE